MAAYPRVPHNVDPDDVPDRERLHRDDLIDDGLRDAEAGMLQHFSDPGAHPQINSRFAPASHGIHIPTPPPTGRHHLEVTDGGAPVWVPFP